MVAVATVLIATGCARTSGDQLRDADVGSGGRGAPATTAPPARSAPPGATLSEVASTHRTTVVTDAGRIEATSVDGDLDVDITPTDGWDYVVERQPQHVRVASTAGGRRVVVDLRSTPGGIAQEVTSSS